MIPFRGERAQRGESEPLAAWEKVEEDGMLSVLVGRDPRLTDGFAEWLSECSGNGSADGSDSDNRSIPGERLADLAAFDADSEDDSDYDPESDSRRTLVLHAVQSGRVRVDGLHWDDRDLIERGADGVWQLCAVNPQLQVRPYTRFAGTPISEPDPQARTKTSNAGTKRKQTVHWGSGTNDVLLE